MINTDLFESIFLWKLTREITCSPFTGVILFSQNTVTEDEVENLVEEIYAERSMSKLQKVARELLTTERAYVDKLNLVDQVNILLLIIMLDLKHLLHM